MKSRPLSAACRRRHDRGVAGVRAGVPGGAGWPAASVRAWEAAPIVVGVAGVDATNTILHGDAWYGLALVLLAGASIATRMVRRAVPAV